MPDPVSRAAAAATLGLHAPLPTGGAPALARLVRDDSDARVRGAALAALVRARSRLAAAAWRNAVADADAAVRRRAAETAPALRSSDAASVVALLADQPSVAETAAFALGEMGRRAVAAGAVPALVEAARHHADPLVREAAVAAIGALGHPDGLPAVLEACGDKPAVRRRAVIALAAFEGPEVEAAIERALLDRDWQVRQTASDLLSASRH